MTEDDWAAALAVLDAEGVAVTPQLLSAETCREISALYDDDRHFRAHIQMRRHGFGQGEYKYFDESLPPVISTLRAQAYAALVPLANRWMERMRSDVRYPETHEAFLTRCHTNGQTRPTPLLLRYGPGDYNCLHQDLYGAEVFPIQLAILLDRPGEDFEGGEFVVTEQRPRKQSRAEVVSLTQGQGVLFAVNERPRRGTKGDHKVRMRHGVSTVRQGRRHTLGIIFHDAA